MINANRPRHKALLASYVVQRHDAGLAPLRSTLPMDATRLAGALYVAVSATAFGAMAIFARTAYASGADVTAVLFLRFLIAGVVMGGVMIVSGRRWPRGRNLAVLVGMGGIGYVAQSFCFFSALNHASAGLVALLLYLHPFMVTLISAALFGHRLTTLRMGAVLAALFGTALTIGSDIGGQPLGILLGVSAAILYSVYILVGSRILGEEDSFAAASVVMLSAAASFGAIVMTGGARFPTTGEGWLAVVMIALACSVVGIACFFAGMQRLGPADSATLSTLEPVVTFVLAGIFLGEPVLVNQVIGGAIILTAVVVLARARVPLPMPG